jgi:hypothetical protein
MDLKNQAKILFRHLSMMTDPVEQREAHIEIFLERVYNQAIEDAFNAADNYDLTTIHEKDFRTQTLADKTARKIAFDISSLKKHPVSK